MTIWSEGAFNFAARSIKYLVGFVRSSDGLLIEPAKCFIGGGDHISTIGSPHSYIHQGHTYCSGHLAEGVANDASLELLLVTGATYQAHLSMEVAGGGDYYVSIFEDTTTSDDGTALTERNKVRAITDTANVTVTHTPTITGDGNQLGPTRYFPGGRAAAGAGVMGASREEWVLDVSTKYLIRVTNKAGSAKTLAAFCEWYDHTPITAKDQV